MWHGVLKRRLVEFSTRGRRPKLPKYPFCWGRPKLPKYPFCQISQFCSKSPPECLEILFRCRDKITKIPFVSGRPKLPKYPFCQISQFYSKSPPECHETLFIYKITQNTSKYSQNSRNYTKY